MIKAAAPILSFKLKLVWSNSHVHEPVALLSVNRRLWVKTGGAESEVKFLATSPLKKDTIVTGNMCVSSAHTTHRDAVTRKGYLQEIFVDEDSRMRRATDVKHYALALPGRTTESSGGANFAESNTWNTKSLADSNVVSKNELALAKAKFDKAKGNIIGYGPPCIYDIKAPFDGIMDHFQVRRGSSGQRGRFITTLSDTARCGFI